MHVYHYIIALCVAIAVLRLIKNRQEARIEADRKAVRQSLRTQASHTLITNRRLREDEQWDRIREQLNWNVPRDCAASRERVH